MKWLKLVLICCGLLSLQVMTASMQSSPDLAPEGIYGETYYAPFPVEITLDGDLGDWEGVPQVYMGQGVGRPAISFAAAADGEYLYLMADIIDNNIISGEHGTDYWNEDSVEFYLNGTGNLELTRYQDGVAQLTIPAINRTLPPDEAIIAGVRGSTLDAQTVTVETDSGWAVEVAVPLDNSIWTIQPEHEKEIGFQVHLNAASELNRDTKLIWSLRDTSDQSYQNPSLFGRLIFYEAAQAPVVTGVYQFTSTLDEDGLIDDFENGIWLDEDDADQLIGLAPNADTTLSIQQVLAAAKMAHPEQSEPADNILTVASGETGGFAHFFTDGEQRISQDWTSYNALGFWLHSTDKQQIQIDIWGDGEVRSHYQLSPAQNGWQYVVIPFDLFASDEAVDYSLISGYGIQLNDADTVYLDDVRLFSVENTSQVLFSDQVPETRFILDDSIDWNAREWELLWADEFDDEPGESINDTYWTCEVGGHGWGNNELEYYTQSTDNVAHDGAGNLVITARQEDPDEDTCWYGACAFTSARCTTQDKVEFTYGRVEARLKIPYGQGIWPAFWMLGANFPEVGWPDSGEIDIMENIGSEPQIVHGTIHGPGYSGASGIGGGYRQDQAFADEFHVYAIEWDPNVIRWYVDGTLYNTVSINDLRNRQWVFDHDFFLIMNIAVGGSWPGFPDESTEFPQTMLVDYVRVYQLASE